MTKVRRGRPSSRLPRVLAAVLIALAAPGSVLWSAPARAAGSSPTWSTLSPPQNPPGLEDASAAYDADNQTVVLFGGQESDGSLSDATWIWNGTTWTQAAAQVSGPTARAGAAMVYDAGLHQLILFGGEAAGGSLLADTWAWNGQSWVSVAGSTSDSGPAARQGASLAVDATGNVVLFGGTGTAPAVSGASAPTPTTTTTPTTSTAAVQASDVSGTTPANPDPVTLNDTWVWDGTAWSQPEVVAAPDARTDASLVWDPAIGQTVLFGGSSTPDGVGPATPLGDTWIWSGSAWTELSPSGAPPARSGASSASTDGLGGALVAAGYGSTGSGSTGNGSTGVQSDAWSFDGSTWTKVTADGTLPARTGAASAWDAAAAQWVIFGGSDGASVLDDTVVLTQAAPITVTPTTSGSGGGASSSTTSVGSVTTGTPAATGTTGGSSTGSNSASTTSPGTAAQHQEPTAGAPTTGGVGTGPARSTSTTSPGLGSPTSDASGTGSAAPSIGASGTDGSRNGSGVTTSPVTGGSAPVIGPGSPLSAPTPVLARPSSTGGSATSTVEPTLPRLLPVQTVHIGSLVTVLGSGFRPGAVITITFHSKPYTVGRAIAGPSGTFAATVTVPPDVSTGQHHLEASGIGRSGTMTVLLTPLRVVSFTDHHATGWNRTTLMMVAVAVFLPLGTWAFLTLRSRRRPARIG